jgi:hypothetical protein
MPGCNHFGGCEAPFLEGVSPDRVLVVGQGDTVVHVTGDLVFDTGFPDPSISISFKSPSGQTFDLTPSETVPQQGGFADVRIPSAALAQAGFAQVSLSRFCDGRTLIGKSLNVKILPDPVVLTPGRVGIPYLTSVSDLFSGTQVDVYLLSFAVIGGSLPDGLSLQQSPINPIFFITGTPAASGDFKFQLQATRPDGFMQAFDVLLHVDPPGQPTPPPAISSISPSSETAGGPTFTLTVNGSNFISASTIDFNGSPLTTAFVSASQLTASVPAVDITTAGPATITVVNPGVATSNAVPFTINPSSQQIGIIAVISESSALVPANALPNPIIALSATGRFAAFENEGASNLDPGVTVSQAQDIYVHDSCAGVSGGCPITTNLASVANVVSFARPDGNGPSIDETAFDSVSISGDGNRIVFVSHATNLVSPTANFEQAYLISCANCDPSKNTPLNNMVSLTVDNVEPDGPSTHAFISAGGRYVAFTSFGTNLVRQLMPAAEAYLRDTSSNCIPGSCTIAVSLDNGNPPNPALAAVQGVAVSANGRFVVFSTSASNLGAPERAGAQVFVRDTCINAPPTPACMPATIMVSVDNNSPTPNPAPSGAFTAGISDDGRFIAFTSEDKLADGGLTPPNGNLYIRDTCQTESGPVAPPCTPTTTTASVATDGSAANAGLLTNLVNPHLLSGNGRFVVFASNATNLLAAGTTTPAGGVFVRDTCLGVTDGSCTTPKTVLVSVDSSGNFVSGTAPAISGDGHYCAFMVTSATSLLFPQEQAVLCRTGF